MPGRRDPHFLQDDRGFYTTSYGPFVLRSAFQPIFSQDEHGHLTIEAFEALIRAQRNGQPVSPPHFFSLVEKDDAIAVDTLCRELHILNMGKLGRRKARLFINFNPGLFDAVTDIDAEVDRMVDVTLKAGLRPGRIVCEITEQGSGDEAVLHRLVSGLRSRLFKIAVDDYGADDSDTRRVDELKPDVLKFDAAWVRRFTETSAGMGLLKLMVDQFIERGITVLFEGLEEDHQVEFCQQIGVQLMQGYALARPEIVPKTFDDRFPEQALPQADDMAVHARGVAIEREPGSGYSATLSSHPHPPRRTATFGKRTR
ncbi:MAG: EAL domain-containing protein [Hoeflea sp.]|uniref:EAL domain-containing protein n=1 Tax=Hoeflea sp. TaxID=1940281 RepID=UPI001D3DBE82|nr:EAL domain-containing protein [Hoeflea sp.]MBU4527197.1 EAL domain-containing protein [Alphaproteobacteria bacterium]MBU4547020.1 EAL domain-containing protein [Alphaproteobacteria bacterium]MBU4551468.1 EAL domain-containing protein [Alphaproteobacteria bacterium]MBV1725473.1 EAL domain-containing protein [Hoeflea sp.]MBV1759521.1 EAL domain-containing protein [Hoeflea sp.]